MPQYYESLELSHAETLLDVVFGVVIGLALTEIPFHLRGLLANLSLKTFYPMLLLISSLLFSAFYWLEVRHFMAAQRSFNIAISDAPQQHDDAVPLPLATFLLGILLMMALATGILMFANEGAFRALCVLSFLFWLCDFCGTLSLKLSYRKFRNAIESVREVHTVDHAWFVGHLVTNYFSVYGATNALIFLILLAIDVWVDGNSTFRVIASAALVAYTLFRHLYWRSRAYSLFLKKRMES